MLVHRQARRRLRIVALVLAAASLASLSAWGLKGAPEAHADTIASKRAEARRVQAQIQAFDMKLEAIIQRYDGAVAHLRGVREEIRQNKADLALAKKNLHAAQQQLARVLVSAYKQGQADPAAFVLASRSIQELIDNLDVAKRATGAEARLLARITASEREIVARQRSLRVEERRARRLVSAAAATKQRVQHKLAQRKQMLASLNAGIRRLIQQREARQAQAAAARAAEATTSSLPPPPASGPAPPASSVGAQAVAIAERYLGVPYVWGGASPSGFDCSGLTMYVYAQLGIQLGHFTGDQWNEGVHVSVDQLAPGDLVFFDNLGHEGMYIGGGEFIHAPHTGDVVKISSMSESWYAQNYDGAVRVTG